MKKRNKGYWQIFDAIEKFILIYPLSPLKPQADTYLRALSPHIR